MIVEGKNLDLYNSKDSSCKCVSSQMYGYIFMECF